MIQTRLIKTYIIALLTCFVLVPSICIPAVIEVRQKYQEKDQWCWAACSEAVLDYYGTVRTQTEIAQYGTDGANIWSWLYGSSTNPTRRGTNLILNHFGQISSTGSNTFLSQETVQNEINGGRPIVIRWGWDSGGGHHLVAHGIEVGTVYLMDPWNGPTINSYNWVTDGGGHTWTDSLRLINNPEPPRPPQPPINLRFEGNAVLAWDPCPGGVVGYRLYYSSDEGNYPISLNVGNVTQYSLESLNLQTGVSHYFAVTAYNDAGESAFSNEIPWTPTTTVAPAPPESFRVH